MTDSHQQDRQRLLKDKRSGFAAFLTVVAWVPALVAAMMLTLPGTHMEARANPLYLVIALPFAWWAVRLTRYEGWPARSIRAAQVAAPTAAAIMAIIAWDHSGPPTAFLVATAVSLTASAVAWVLYGGSLLQREGPLS